MRLYYLDFFDVGLFSERQKERVKEGEMKRREGGREGGEILIGCMCTRISGPIVKDAW